MAKSVFGRPISAVEVERLPADTGPTDFVRLCGALIGRALAERVGSFALPATTERINVRDEGVDAEYAAPELANVAETRGLIGPGRTVFQFKYRDVSAVDRARLVRGLAGEVRKEARKVAPTCDRYVLMTNVHLTPAQGRRLRDALVEGAPALAGKVVVIWGAAEIALALNSTPYLRHLFFAAGGLCTLDYAEGELKRAYRTLGWPEFVNREEERAAIETFLEDRLARALLVTGPRYVGKTRLVIEALKARGALILWAVSPDQVSVDHFRDLDSEEGPGILVVDGCDVRSAYDLLTTARARAWMKTIIVATGPGLADAATQRDVLRVGPWQEPGAFAFIGRLVPGISFAEQSWVAERTGGNPGLMLYLAPVLGGARLSGVAGPDELRGRLGHLLDRAFLTPLDPDARRALEVASVMPVLGTDGEPAKEAAAVARAMGLSPESLRSQIQALERTGLVQRRGRFVEVVPPLLAEHVAALALARPETKLAELRLSLEAGAFRRFLERFRNLPGPEVRAAVARLLSPSGWFPDLDRLLAGAEEFRILAPAAPSAALQCIQRAVEGLSAGDLTTRVSRAARRVLVHALDNLTLRSETYEGAARILLALAEAENEKLGNNATGVFLSLFHWAHPELPVRLPVRLRVLEYAAGSSSEGRRRLAAAACGEAFHEGAVLALHHVDGPALPESRVRLRSYDEVRQYAAGVLTLLERLAEDTEPGVRREAVAALRTVFQPFVRLSLREDRLDDLGIKAIAALGEAGRKAESAQVRADIASRLELTRDNLTEGPARASPAVEDAVRRIDELLEKLTGESFLDRVWRWIGPPSLHLEEELVRYGDVSAAIRGLAAELLADPGLFAQHLEWLTGVEAKQRVPLFRELGRMDRGGELFRLLVANPSQPFWPDAFGAYVQGWRETEPERAETALDELADSHPELALGIVTATGSLPTCDRTVDRLLRVVGGGEIPRLEVVREAGIVLPWERLSPEDTERLIRALDTGEPEGRGRLLFAFRVRLARRAPLTPSLRELAWSFLGSTSPVCKPVDLRSDWDAVAAALGKEEPERLLRIMEDILTRDRGLDESLIDPRQQLPRVLSTLKERCRSGFVGLLLQMAVKPDAPAAVARILLSVLDPLQDRETLRRLALEADPEGTSAIVRWLDADKPGFWEVARDLVAVRGEDKGARSALVSRLLSGTWTGSAVPMIEGRLAKARALKDDDNPNIVSWAVEAESALKGWLEHAREEDREAWIWDYRIPRNRFRAMLGKKGSPERLWAIGRLLEDAPPERVLELLTPREIMEALPKLDHLDERKRQMWSAYARLGPHAH